MHLEPREPGRKLRLLLLALLFLGLAATLHCAARRTPPEPEPLPTEATELRAAIDRDHERLKELVSQEYEGEKVPLPENAEFMEIAERLPKLQVALEEAEARQQESDSPPANP